VVLVLTMIYLLP